MSDAALGLHHLPVGTRASARSRALAGVLARIHGTIPVLDRPDLASCINWKANATAPIHRWLRYREAYSPRLIEKLGLRGPILDPFCGCGSILVGAAEASHAAVGIDINPLAVFAARVKLSPLSLSELRAVHAFADRLSKQVKSASPWPAPGLAIAHKVFEPDILE